MVNNLVRKICCILASETIQDCY